MNNRFHFGRFALALLLLTPLLVVQPARAQTNLTAAQLAVTVPTPVFPTGSIPINRLVYIWTPVSGAAQYQYQVYQGTTLVMDKVASNLTCTAGTCAIMPIFDLNAGTYTWRVRALVNSVYQAYSAPQTFTVSVELGGFYSPFTSNASGWVVHKGTWVLESSNFYTTVGVAGKASTISHINNYSTLTYEVRMKRTGCLGCANVIAIRGNPSLDTVGWWNTEYTFDYTNSGLFSVWRDSNGTYTALKDWTTTSAIVRGGWNVLKVVADGPSLKFYINDVLVWSGSDTNYPTGRVGIGMYRSATSTGNKLLVDWAQLETAITSAAAVNGLQVAPEATAEPTVDTSDQVEVPGGNHNMAP